MNVMDSMNLQQYHTYQSRSLSTCGIFICLIRILIPVTVVISSGARYSDFCISAGKELNYDRIVNFMEYLLVPRMKHTVHSVLRRFFGYKPTRGKIESHICRVSKSPIMWVPLCLEGQSTLKESTQICFRRFGTDLHGRKAWLEDLYTELASSI